MIVDWLKLDINILNDEKIRIIRTFPDGDSLFVLWVGLLCLAMKSRRPGIVEIADDIPYSIDDLSGLFNIEKKTVELGIGLFVKYQMISIFNGGSLDILNFPKHQKLEQIEHNREQTRERVKKYRERLKCNALLTHDTVTSNATDTDTDTDTDTEEDIEINSITIPLSDGTNYQPTTAIIKELQSLYPTLDTIQQLRNIRAWNLADPQRRKTRRGIMRHITTWMQNSMERQERSTGGEGVRI